MVLKPSLEICEGIVINTADDEEKAIELIIEHNPGIRKYFLLNSAPYTGS